MTPFLAAIMSQNVFIFAPGCLKLDTVTYYRSLTNKGETDRSSK
jgi:hypothetical protein